MLNQKKRKTNPLIIYKNRRHFLKLSMKCRRMGKKNFSHSNYFHLILSFQHSRNAESKKKKNKSANHLQKWKTFFETVNEVSPDGKKKFFALELFPSDSFVSTFQKC